MFISLITGEVKEIQRTNNYLVLTVRSIPTLLREGDIIIYVPNLYEQLIVEKGIFVFQTRTIAKRTEGGVKFVFNALSVEPLGIINSSYSTKHPMTFERLTKMLQRGIEGNDETESNSEEN